MYTHILVPTDGSERSEEAVGQAVALAAALGARVTFLAVTRPLHSIAAEPQTVGPMSDEALAYVHDYMTADTQAWLDSAKSRAASAGVSCETRREENEHIHQAIIEAAEGQGCDLVAMASHGRSGLSAIVLGSETVKVLTHSTVPVLVYR